MARMICKECGRTADSEADICELCGGNMEPAGYPKAAGVKKTSKFSAAGDLGRESSGDFSPVPVRAIKPKTANRTILDFGKQEKRTSKQKLKTACFVLGTLMVAFLLAMSIRHFFGDYNVKFSSENAEKRQMEQQDKQIK